MPLIRHVPSAEKLDAIAKAATADTVIASSATEDPKEAEAPKPIYTGRKKADAPMTKDDYWRNREERDVEKDKHIRLSGVLHAVLDSVNFGQYCTGTTAEEYLTKVEDAALRLAKFVTEKAQ